MITPTLPQRDEVSKDRADVTTLVAGEIFDAPKHACRTPTRDRKSPSPTDTSILDRPQFEVQP
jgi:hypothetical protein